MRDKLVSRALFLAAFLVAVTLTTAVILAVVTVARPGHGSFTVRPAATASPAHGSGPGR